MSATIRVSKDSSWQSSLSSPDQRLALLLQSSRLSDLTITFPGHDNILKAHRLVLAMSSPVFEAMLYGPLAEGPDLTIHDDPPEAFEWLLDYMYRGHTSLPAVPLTVQVYQLASKYQMEALMTLCSQHLKATLSATNLPEMYDTAILLQDNTLLQQCSLVVNHSPTAVLSSPQFGRLTRSALKHLSLQPLHITTEVVLLRALLAWGRAQTSSGNLRQEIEDFLPMVRFLAMTTDEFVEHVMPANVLTLEESSAILMNIKEVRDVPLPAICCHIREKRLCFHDSLLRKITLNTLHNFPRSKKSARGSIFVHSSHEQILIMNMKTVGTIQLGKVECKAINPSSGSATVSVKDGGGNVIKSATSEGLLVTFEEPVTILPDAPHTLTVCMEGHWPRGEMGDFMAQEEEVKLDGKLAYTEGRFGTVTLYFWSFN
ncbi:BTB/POZ domain-containing protein 6-A-like [Homarus americanus]|uniref:BTB/POZ domain-containing protein 6-A-like n=1 Tax=Homarus americanus TaxID=6706 RepID=UPI001C44777E|nr:BTB/POZ domain-containing protein 6-A-like [Homarus americanus]XP_042218264.1 BTB/POZ domain-containing protein 6-A-like [Homarus americanus]XP_042218265.1 BTB/POZ domain-containing protein 6-A-like [Homarus americanus]